MWDHRYLSRLDFRMIPIILALMVISIVVIASMTGANFDEEGTTVFTMWVLKQIRFFIMGWIVYFVFAALDYRKFKEWVWIFYLGILILLVGLFLFPLYITYKDGIEFLASLLIYNHLREQNW